tara:strand:+ start:4039 stop:5232 length:1194 start_codon:yes stop_codon:yes gene_type:complete
MSFFKKIFKGVKKVVKGVGKVFKKIGRGIKKAVVGIGKFMDKIGIVGQIGLSLLLPGIGAAIGNLAGSMMASTTTGILGSAIRGAGTVLNAAVNVGSKVSGVFKTVTEGVTKVVGNVAGAALNKIPGADKLVSALTKGKIDLNNYSFKNAWTAAQGAISDVAAQGADLFSMDTLTANNKFIKPETLAKLDAAKVAVDQDPVAAVADAAKVPDPVKPTEAIKPADPVTQTDPFVQEQLDTPVRDPGVVRSSSVERTTFTDETGFGGSQIVTPDQPPGLLSRPEDIAPIQVDTTVTTPDVTGTVAPNVATPVIPEKPTGFQKVTSFVADEVSERIDSFDPVKGAQRAFAAFQGKPTGDITANEELGGGYAVDFGAATIGYNPDGAMNYFPLVGNLRGVA